MYFDTIIIGGGPAGTGPLFKAMKDGSMKQLLNNGLAIIEQSSDIVIGSLSKYEVNSDTLSDAFLECLDGLTGTFINVGELSEEVDLIKRYKGNPIPLKSLDKFLLKLGRLLLNIINKHPKCQVFVETRVTKIVKRNADIFELHLDKDPQKLIANKVVVATGGIASPKISKETKFAEKILLRKYTYKAVHADEVLSGVINEKLKAKIIRARNIVILGGSHSAFSVAHYLIEQFQNTNFETGAIKIYCNEPPKLFFSSKQEAIEHNYFDFNENDFCPITNRLYRLRGLRMDGRKLYMKILGMFPNELERRVVVKNCLNQDTELTHDLKRAEIIILATGYSFNIPPLFENDSIPLSLWGQNADRWVNDNCEILDHKKEPILNLYGIGLASGFIPSGKLGGELSFNKQTNGIWYYQNALGEMILNQLLLIK